MRRLLFLIITLMAVPAFAAPAPALPQAVDLLRAAVKTANTLHPATVRIEGDTVSKSQPTMHIVYEVVRNDAGHSVTKSTMRGGDEDLDTEIYRNGRNVVSYLPHLKIYEKEGPDTEDVGDINALIGVSLDSLLPGMTPQDIAAHSEVHEETVKSGPVYQVTVSNPAQKKPAEADRIIATNNRSDNLPKQVTVHLLNGDELTFTFTYQRPATPYPASTFVFVPPPGVKEMPKGG